MISVRFRKIMRVAAVAFVAMASSSVLLAQGEAAAGASSGSVLHLFGAALGVGMIVIGAGLGIGRFAAAAAEGIARQPAAAAQITGAVNLPLFLLEGVAIIAEVVVLLIVLLNGRPIGG
jgi:F-type H+-transporting ATPase subunit c